MDTGQTPRSKFRTLNPGYFATGDVGEWTPDGNLKIIDRKKNLVKLKGGEYVALEFMENKYGNSEFVDAIAGEISQPHTCLVAVDRFSVSELQPCEFVWGKARNFSS